MHRLALLALIFFIPAMSAAETGTAFYQIRQGNANAQYPGTVSDPAYWTAETENVALFIDFPTVPLATPLLPP